MYAKIVQCKKEQLTEIEKERKFNELNVNLICLDVWRCCATSMPIRQIKSN